MRQYTLLLLAGLLAASCQKQDAVAPAEAPDPDWLRLEIPTSLSGDEAYSIAGDLSQTLLVAARQKVYSSADQGKTWQESYNFFGPVDLLERNDTVFALKFFPSSLQGEPVAGFADMYTADQGKSWHYTADVYPYEEYRAVRQRVGWAQAAGITYQTRENTRAIPNSSSRLVLASDLLREEGGRQTSLRLPARHYLKNLRLDGQNRLYVAASSLRFDEQTGEAILPIANNSAVVYVSRKPLP
ncbi:hypothetical protein [Hymenobacter cellulosivorans]|uniref:Exo-alpha-sialidase n=1 Tax=Hymenobacter cellulosivorans TaxID=2932249 RepID=A0ABY4FCW9_9BACT|nr:hypothetical protein [Hymenobacter cellulosivorans]UOQ52316.1 hypothetical protein MUN80_21465 [Hymenobacter cellulosivorans]